MIYLMKEGRSEPPLFFLGKISPVGITLRFRLHPNSDDGLFEQSGFP